MRGRKPKPTALKLLEGNPGKRALPRDEPRPAAGLPTCPTHLCAKARREWRRIGQELAAVGMITRVDRAALAAYCAAYARWADAETKAQEQGILVKTNGQVMTNPYIRVAESAMKLMRQFLVEFGLTPSSRSRLSAPAPKPASPGGELAEFLHTPLRLAQ